MKNYYKGACSSGYFFVLDFPGIMILEKNFVSITQLKCYDVLQSSLFDQIGQMKQKCVQSQQLSATSQLQTFLMLSYHGICHKYM